MNPRIRPAAVAGTFYPGHPDTLSDTVDGLLARATRNARPTSAPKALVVPHAGYVYSGPIAATAYATLSPHADVITRVVLLGPAHRVAVRGIVSPGATAFATPLGTMPVDLEALAKVPEVRPHPDAHAFEHSLEVQIPFLQRVLPHAKLVPLVVGLASPEEVARVLDALWGGPETVILISSDLSHYLPYSTAHRVDEATAQRIASLDPTLSGEDACGAHPLNGLLAVARRRGLRVEALDLRTSGDTAGSKDEVVGYGAFAFHEEALRA